VVVVFVVVPVAADGSVSSARIVVVKAILKATTAKKRAAI
jgi:hypothetical protein